MIKHKNTPFRRLSKGAGIAALVVMMSGCTDAAGYDLDYLLGRVSFLTMMRTTVAYPPHTMPRLPAEGTVPVASPGGLATTVFTQAELETVAAGIPNPVEPTDAVLARGAVVYQNQCFTCHGAQGEGDGPVVGGGRFPLGPDLIGPMAAGRTDGYIYGVTRVGRGLMPAYGDRIPESDRWAVVHYVRQLQGASGAAPAAAPAADAPAADAPADAADQPVAGM